MTCGCCCVFGHSRYETLREQLQMCIPQSEGFNKDVISQQEPHGDLTDNCVVDAVKKTQFFSLAVQFPTANIAVGSHAQFSL